MSVLLNGFPGIKAGRTFLSGRGNTFQEAVRADDAFSRPRRLFDGREECVSALADCNIAAKSDRKFLSPQRREGEGESRRKRQEAKGRRTEKRPAEESA